MIAGDDDKGTLLVIWNRWFLEFDEEVVVVYTLKSHKYELRSCTCDQIIR